MKPREHRHKVLVRAQIRMGLSLPTEACVRDVSSRGMLIQAAFPPRRGTYVEVMLAQQTVTGRVVWSKGRRFGVSTRERVDLSAIVGGVKDHATPQAAMHHAVRSTSNLRGRLALARVYGSMIDYGFIIVLTMAMIATAAAVAHDTLAEPLETISARLNGER